MREGQTQERRAGQQNRLPQKDVGTRKQLCRPPPPSLCEDLLWPLSLKRRSAHAAERGAAGLQGDQERSGEGRRGTRGSRATCFSPEAEGAEGALPVPDVQVRHQLTAAVVHVLPACRGQRASGG